MPGDRIRSLHRSFGKQIGSAAPEWVVDRYRRWTTDAYVVSFPKSGRTWFRTIVGTVIQIKFGAKDFDPTSVHRMWVTNGNIPRLVFTHDMDAHLAHHEQVTWNGARYRGRPTILLVRDPRDTIVSLYFEMSKRVHAYDGSIGDFIRQDAGGIASLVAFMNAWIDNIDQLPRHLILSYEDLHMRPEETISRALEFMGVRDVDGQTIRAALDRCSFDTMRRMESEGAVDHVRLTPGNVADLQSYKVRSGKVGGYRNHLSPEDCTFLDGYIGRELDRRYPQYIYRS